MKYMMLIPALLIPLVSSATISWQKGSEATDDYYKRCHAYLQFWSYSICVLAPDWENNLTKIDHVANVFMQLIDSDADMLADDL